MGVLQSVTYWKWAALNVVVGKTNESARNRADFSTGLNSSLEKNNHPLPAGDALFSILNDGKFFAKMDPLDVHLQVKVEAGSCEFQTIATREGLFQYTRPPFGIETAPVIFQHNVDGMTSGPVCSTTYFDGIIVVGDSAEGLQGRVENSSSISKNIWFLLRTDKYQFFLTSIKYIGFILDSSGRYPDPDETRDIARMLAPTNLRLLRSFLGVRSYDNIARGTDKYIGYLVRQYSKCQEAAKNSIHQHLVL
ncbi:unnamed protein product [Hymenolepis diminuta]|uniref:Peptidase S1 domain-containing protein n=1 Tax=Hymenolepis diminuta TaxID=6216 RepID=A0A0R3SFW5_HYMDI|nr:unnamed protein product [Hymenolepis diminuta]